MTVYVINNLKIHDRGAYGEYLSGFMEAFRGCGGEILAVQDSPKAYEGEWPYDRTVLLRFPDRASITRWVEARLRLLPPRWIAFGLAVALATGLGSLALGHPFLTTHTAHVTWPLVGEVHLPTAAIFDLGVFAVVVGSTLLLLTAIAHQSLRARRRQGLAPADGRDG